MTYAHPGGDVLFSDVSFRVPPGRSAGLVGVNGVGKSTLLRILAGELAQLEGTVAIDGDAAYMPQDLVTAGHTVRELMLCTAPAHVRRSGATLVRAELALAHDPDDSAAGIAIAESIAAWSDHGGYELEGRWDAITRRVLGAGIGEVGGRPADSLSGGERKRLTLELLFSSDATVLLLDEPDNFLDIPGKRWLEDVLRRSRKTVAIISHDRELLAAGVDVIVTLEGQGAWVHGGSYRDYPEAREHRQQLLGDRLERWREEERRLFRLVRTFKERARYSSDWASRAAAAESRWKRFTAEGPPEKPTTDKPIRPRLKGGDSARRVVMLEDVTLPGLTKPASDEIRFGERVGLIGPNGTGKSHLIRLLAGEPVEHRGSVRLGPRVSAGLFTQHNARPVFDTAETVLDVAAEYTPSTEHAMSALARYGLQDTGRRAPSTLSGGQRARLEILCLELEGHNLLLLDEPTDNLDILSAEALESALDGFEGTVIAVSHDRRFLRRLDRFLMLDQDGELRVIPDANRALEALGAAAADGGAEPART